MKYDLSPMYLQGRKKLLIEETLWGCVETLLDHAYEIEPEDQQGLKEWATRSLVALEELGYAVRDVDEDGNLIFCASPKLLAETGTRLGSLQWRGWSLADC
jgi:hypothetical protein